MCLFIVLMLSPDRLISFSINQKLLSTVSFQPLLLYLNPLFTYSKAKCKCVRDKGSPFFELFLIGNVPEKFFLPGLYCSFHLNTFLFTSTLPVSYTDTKFNKNIIQDFPPK